MDQMMAYQTEKYLNVCFEVAKRLAHAGYNLELPVRTTTWGQIANDFSTVLVDNGIEPDQLTDETLISLVEGIRGVFQIEGSLHWQMIVRSMRIAPLLGGFTEGEEPDEGVLTEQLENATRLGDEEGYWVDGGASANFLED